MYSLDIPGPGLVIEDSDRDAMFRVGRDGQLPELALLHSHVPVSVDLLTSEPFLPGLFWLERSETVTAVTSQRSGWQ